MTLQILNDQLGLTGLDTKGLYKGSLLLRLAHFYDGVKTLRVAPLQRGVDQRIQPASYEDPLQISRQHLHIRQLL